MAGVTIQLSKVRRALTLAPGFLMSRNLFRPTQAQNVGVACQVPIGPRLVIASHGVHNEVIEKFFLSQLTKDRTFPMVNLVADVFELHVRLVQICRQERTRRRKQTVKRSLVQAMTGAQSTSLARATSPDITVP